MRRRKLSRAAEDWLVILVGLLIIAGAGAVFLYAIPAAREAKIEMIREAIRRERP